MNNKAWIASAVALTVAWVFAPVSAVAYVDVELDGNRHVIGTSYAVQGAKLIVYRQTGAVEINRDTVRAIRERDGAAPSDHPVASTATPQHANAKTAAAIRPTDGRVHDPQARERELASRLMAVRIDRLAAKQRGEHDTVEKLEKDIRQLQGERTANWSELHPEDARTK
jgi:hypothetical protein